MRFVFPSYNQNSTLLCCIYWAIWSDQKFIGMDFIDSPTVTVRHFKEKLKEEVLTRTVPGKNPRQLIV